MLEVIKAIVLDNLNTKKGNATFWNFQLTKIPIQRTISTIVLANVFLKDLKVQNLMEEMRAVVLANSAFHHVQIYNFFSIFGQSEFHSQENSSEFYYRIYKNKALAYGLVEEITISYGET